MLTVAIAPDDILILSWHIRCISYLGMSSRVQRTAQRDVQCSVVYWPARSTYCLCKSLTSWAAIDITHCAICSSLDMVYTHLRGCQPSNCTLCCAVLCYAMLCRCLVWRCGTSVPQMLCASCALATLTWALWATTCSARSGRQTSERVLLILQEAVSCDKGHTAVGAAFTTRINVELAHIGSFALLLHCQTLAACCGLTLCGNLISNYFVRVVCVSGWCASVVQ